MKAKKKPITLIVGVVVGLAVFVLAFAPVLDSFLIDRAVPTMGGGSSMPLHLEVGFKVVRPIGKIAMSVRPYYDYWRWVRGELSSHPLPPREKHP